MYDRPLQQGDVVWTEISDDRGFKKLRVTRTEEIDPGGDILVVSVTTTIPDTMGPEFVELPWSAHEHTPTRFRRRSLANCAWRRTVRIADCSFEGGVVPPEHMKAVLAAIMRLLKE